MAVAASTPAVSVVVLTAAMSTFRILGDIRMKFPFVRTAPSCSRLLALNLRTATGGVLSSSLGGAAGCLRVCLHKCDAAGRSHPESWQPSADERFLRAHDAELISLRVGQDNPGLSAGLPDVYPASSEREETADLMVAVRGAAGEAKACRQYGRQTVRP